jgi:hypothetical protein
MSGLTFGMRRSNMRGVIEQVWDNESRNGQQYLNVQIDGERYSVWDTKYFNMLAPGATIDYEIKQSGKFRNLTDVTPVESGNNGELPPYQPNHKDRQIARMSCLKSASEILAPVQLEPETKKKKVIETARFFERYVFEEDFELNNGQNQVGQRAGNSK